MPSLNVFGIFTAFLSLDFGLYIVDAQFVCSRAWRISYCFLEGKNWIRGLQLIWVQFDLSGLLKTLTAKCFVRPDCCGKTGCFSFVCWCGFCLTSMWKHDHSCRGFFFPLKLEVQAPPGTTVGYVVQNWHVCLPKFTIQDEKRTDILKIIGPCIVCRCCEDVNFEVCNVKPACMYLFSDSSLMLVCCLAYYLSNEL